VVAEHPTGALVVRQDSDGQPFYEAKWRRAKSWQARALPLADPAASPLARLADRGDHTGRDDYVFCSRLRRRLDPSAVRRRYKRARELGP
jgi:hypothetical protein